MNLTNDSSENDNDKDSSSDEDDDEDNENLFINSPSILVDKFFCTTTTNNINEEFDSNSDDDISDIENHYFSDDNNQSPRQNRLCTILRQSNPLVQLKLNLIHNNNQSLLRDAISDSDMSKQGHHIFRLRRLYLPSSSNNELQTQITNWLQASTCLIDSISTSTYHRRCWSQLLLTYFIERRFVNLQFILCTHSILLTTIDHDSCSIHQHACVPEEDAYKLCSILQKGSRFNIDSNIFDHIRRIIVIKSMQEAINDNTNLQELYVKQLTSLKQSLNHQQSSVTNINDNNITINVASIYSKLLLFLSSLYSIKAETMQTLFCQHLLHNPMYSYLVTS
ncbi:unnamed protein product [Adineta steineri]|uniref:Uncharacterized protein n=1 Tax=Adineta steineri TaxID=433720 RepID=A0A819M9U9_9BILA|nr:unnamed protein product [Adineta steineri]CAF1287681.1 unnamed protein product [Adineta steineri]CAF1376144.1 unnamed protein product [Adineta steineri]CAF3976923.1 unnamed protein product [Adineta steineri]